jgi:Kdo2-lipid IVA lauroyltransferase/acyltransferase
VLSRAHSVARPERRSGLISERMSVVASPKSGRPWPTRVLHRLEAWLARFGVALVRALPPATASALGGWLGRTIGPHLPRTEVARRNLRRAYPDATAATIEAIVRGMWDNLGRTFFEFPHLDRFTFFRDDRSVEVIGTEYIDGMRDGGRPSFFFSAHIANWELMGKCAAARGMPAHLIYRAPNNPEMAWLYEGRRSGDGELVPKGAQGARRALKLLAAGGHFGILMDQKMNDGIAVPFFGRDAMTAPGLAELALRFGCPVVPVHAERLGGMRFRIVVEAPLDVVPSGDHAADVAALTREVTARIEGWIRARPEQWLWLHRRWPDS